MIAVAQRNGERQRDRVARNVLRASRRSPFLPALRHVEPASGVVSEFKHKKDRKAPTLHIDADGVCDACRYAEKKEQIDWEAREAELHRLLDRSRRHDGGYDCICPGSGGKDSVYAAHLLKYKYGMHPLTVTWPPILYTDYGLANFRCGSSRAASDKHFVQAERRVQRLLTRLGIENLLHPFQTFILGQKNVAPKIALKYKIR